MQNNDLFDGGSVMLCAEIHNGGRTAFMHLAGALSGIRYRDEILQHHVIPHMNFNGGMFQHDSVRPYVARVSQECAAPKGPDITLACIFAGFKPIRPSTGCILRPLF